MKILICLKQILDPELPARDFRVDGAKREADSEVLVRDVAELLLEAVRPHSREEKKLTS